MLTAIIVILAIVIGVGIVMIWLQVSGRAVLTGWGYTLDAPVGIFLVVISIGGMAYCYGQYSEVIEKAYTNLTKVVSELKGELNRTQDTRDKAKAELDATRGALSEKTSEADELKTAVASQQAERREAQDMVRAAWMMMNQTSLSERQRAEYNQIRDGVLALNDRLTLLKIRAVDRPSIEGRKAIAIFEIYQKAFEADQTRPRGAGLFEFQSEQFKVTADYDGRMGEVMRSEIAQAVCHAALSALVQGISLSEAISQIPTIRSYDVDSNFVNGLAEFKYVQMQFQLMAGNALTLVRGYADGERGPWRNRLDTTPKIVEVHENAHPNAMPVDYALTFREALTPVSIGREEKGVTTYGNDDLPNLRAAEAADILMTLTNGCPPPAPNGNASAGTTTVEILDGRVYPEHREVDRRVRVYLLAFLKEQ